MFYIPFCRIEFDLFWKKFSNDSNSHSKIDLFSFVWTEKVKIINIASLPILFHTYTYLLLILDDLIDIVVVQPRIKFLK